MRDASRQNRAKPATLVPGHYIRRLVDALVGNPAVRLPEDALTIEAMIEGKQFLDAVKEPRRYDIQERTQGKKRLRIGTLSEAYTLSKRVGAGEPLDRRAR